VNSDIALDGVRLKYDALDNLSEKKYALYTKCTTGTSQNEINGRTCRSICPKVRIFASMASTVVNAMESGRRKGDRPYRLFKIQRLNI